MARLSEEEINNIRSKSDIVDVISRYVSINRKGKNYWCTCPFHDDHSPSMSISTDKQIYKCFVCGAGGNVFTFISQFEKVPFVEAVYKVAELSGISIDKKLLPTKMPTDPKLLPLLQAMQDSLQFTHYQLDTQEGKIVKDYLKKRNISGALIEKFAFGYNPPKNALYKFLNAKKHTDQDLLNAGLIRESKNGFHDVFSNRFMIPIHNAKGEIVGYSARSLNEEDKPKYVNTSQTSLYTKSNLLFNYHRVKDRARMMKKVFLVEGAMDVLALEKVGIENAIATLGTACGKEQIQLMKQLHVPIVVNYDGDKAGKDATYKFGILANSHGLPFEIVDNKYDLDPDEIIEKHGADELRQLIERTIPWIEFIFYYLQQKFNLQNYSQKKEFAITIGNEINKLQNDFEKDNYYVRLKQLSDFDMRTPSSIPPKSKTQKQRSITFKNPKSKQVHAQHVILSQMLNGVLAANYYKENLGFLMDETCDKLAIYIADYYRHHKQITIADLLDFVQDASAKHLLIDIANWELAQDDINMTVLTEAIEKVKECTLDKKIQDINSSIHSILDPKEKAKLALQKNELIKQREEWRNAGRK